MINLLYHFPIYQNDFICSTTHSQVHCLLNLYFQAQVPCCSCQGIGLIVHVLVSVGGQPNIICITKVFQDISQCPSNPPSSITSHLSHNLVDPQNKQKGGKNTPLSLIRGHPEGVCKRCVANNLGLEVTVKHRDDIYQL